ncbi:MAG TPA: hypothetical protein EYN54_03660 [Methylococcaceae bacterium]|nr:hypothetical protein [Methylococcaceae bacterium]
MTIKMMVCVACNEEFSGSSNAMYCSNKCKQASYRAAKALGGFIYILKNKGRVVYVGQSITKAALDDRLVSHSCGRESKVFDSHEYYRVDGCNLNEVEAAEIIKYTPKYNKRLPSNNTYITVKQFSSTLSELIEGFIINQCETHTLIGELGVKKAYLEASKSDEFRNTIEKILSKTLVNKTDGVNK